MAKDKTGDNKGTARKPAMSEEEVRQMVSNMLSKGDAEGQLAKVVTENFNYRMRIRDLETEVEDLQTQLPEEGSVVLTPTQKKEWEAFTAIGKPAAEVATTFAETTQVKATNEELIKDKTLTDVVKAEGYKEGADKVLKRLVGDRAIVIEPVEEKDPEDEAKKVNVPRAFIVTTDPTSKVETKKRLTEVLESDFKEFLPSLVKDDAAAHDEIGNNGDKVSGTPYGKQGQGSKASAKRPSTAYLNKVYSKPTQAGT